MAAKPHAAIMMMQNLPHFPSATDSLIVSPAFDLYGCITDVFVTLKLKYVVLGTEPKRWKIEFTILTTVIFS